MLVMMLKSGALLTFTLSLSLLSGCTIIEMQNQNEAAVQRIGEKGHQAEQIEQENRMLHAEGQRLAAELKDKQLSLTDLTNRLTALRQQNEKLQAGTLEERNKKAAVDAKIQSYQREIATLGNGRSSEISPAQKAQRVEELKSRIRDYLDIGLNE